MSDVGEALKKIGEVKRTAEGYLAFDALAGGLISKTVKELTAMEQLLENPSAHDVDECLKKVDSLLETFSPYRSYAADIIDKIASCRVDLEKAKEKLRS